jgi:hypothetical protein
VVTVPIQIGHTLRTQLRVEKQKQFTPWHRHVAPPASPSPGNLNIPDTSKANMDAGCVDHLRLARGRSIAGADIWRTEE